MPIIEPIHDDNLVTQPPESNLTVENPVYKPFRYPWCYDAWLTQQRIHWLPEEIPMADDVRDWQKNLNPTEKNLLTQIFRFFTQADVEVNNAYITHYMTTFKPTEVLMMMSAFSNIETIHIAAYSFLLDTIGMPEIEYSAFLKYKEMKDKYEYMHNFNTSSKTEIAKTMAVFSAFTEGLQLFASFAILLNFPRHNKMKGMGQIVTWSVRDETLHCNSMIKLFRTYVKENPEIWNAQLKNELQETCNTIVKHEDAFIDLAFELGSVEGLKAQDVKDYIRWIGNRRLLQLGINPIFKIETNPLPWLDTMLNAVEHMNFFEGRATEYSKASTQGSWVDAFSDFDSRIEANN
ncbi:MAG: Ribonucleoside-diphosphate reductase subunit beta [Alphaproteobacteria bacterium MarineAlpha5_Bin11]|nr:ribonucleotide-diphosphate reductase subunit beta [Pelagibacteraceae bacterium]PPR45174.1 MAG: Ribonucleoside-diphosphate reductase subunit beta [Alphaproteobacteria bacterium MarineAlpha5_Bin11]PPR52146.1 MAG: Ribonucleoside-diphosphate reductase subunit beta [Alphaproteobacteria bacterium MarineAlpha5_Bin10]|tara:strand:+ start:6291 stop:7334 length:1044 start_codon:yes stop_codon:yes gene_type:complete